MASSPIQRKREEYRTGAAVEDTKAVRQCERFPIC